MKNRFHYSDKIINLAAQYWINIIKTGKDHDNGDNSFESFACSYLANKSTKELENEKLENFRKAFFEEFKKVIEKYHKENGVSLYCDYHPDWILSEAAKKADINEMQFPWKTGIIVGTDYIIEQKPYARKSFKDSLIYCEHSYLQSLIADAERQIKKIPNEKWLSEERKKEYIKDYQDNLRVYQKLLRTLPNGYIRDNLK